MASELSGKPLLSVTTFGALKMFWREQDITYDIRKALEGRGPSLILLKVLLCCGCPSEQSGERGTGDLPFLVHEASIDWLIEAIWSDEARTFASPEQALRKAKSQLNCAFRPYLGGDLILGLGRHRLNSYRLEGRLLQIDADLFEQVVSRASLLERQGEATFSCWQRAAFLGTGDFLPADIYAEWAISRRRRIENKYRRCLHRLVAHASGERERAEAIETLYSYLHEHPDELDLLCTLVPLLREQQRYQEALELCERLKIIYQEEEEEVPTEVSELITVLRREQRSARFQQLGLSPLALAASSETEARHQAPSRGDPSPSVMDRPPQSGSSPGSSVAWFDLKLKQWRLLITAWRGRALYCEELQAILDQELAMTDLIRSLFEDFPVTRRKALVALSVVPVSLLGAARENPTSAKVLEEFLPQCATGLTACHHLMRGQDIFLAEKAIKQFLPVIEYVAQQPSLHQTAAARLAAQGRKILSLLGWHRGQPQDRIKHLERAVEFAYLTKDLNVQATMLTSLGHTYSQLSELSPHRAMQYYQEVLQYEQELSPLTRSFLHNRIALAHAQLGQEREARLSLDMAYTFFSNLAPDDPGLSLHSDWSASNLYQNAGMTYFALGKPSDGQIDPHYLQLAWEAYEYINNHPQMLISERIRIEVANHQAATAIAQGDMEKFQHYFLLGVEGAKVLKSQKRKQEAIENWKGACQVWGNEAGIVGLAERLM